MNWWPWIGSWHRWFLGTALVSSLAGCPATTQPEDDDDGGDDDDTPLFAVEGRLSGPDGSPVVGMAVTVSTEFCIADVSDDDGRFRIEGVSPGPKRLIIYGSTSEYAWPSLSSAFDTTDDGTDHTFGSDIVLPPLTSVVAADPDSEEVQTVTLAAGLELTILPGSVTLAPLADPELRSGTLVAADAPFDEVPSDATNLWAIEPIRTTFAPPAEVRLPLSGFEPDQAFTIWSVDYDTGVLEHDGTATINPAGDELVSDPGSGIRTVGWHTFSPTEEP